MWCRGSEVVVVAGSECGVEVVSVVCRGSECGV